MDMNSLAQDYIESCQQRYNMALEVVDRCLEKVESSRSDVNCGDYPFLLADPEGSLLYIRNKNDIEKVYPFYMPDDDDINFNFDSLATIPINGEMLRLFPLKASADVNLLGEGKSLEPRSVTIELFDQIHAENFVDLNVEVKQLDDEVVNNRLFHALGRSLLEFDCLTETKILKRLKEQDGPIVNDKGEEVSTDVALYEIVMDTGRDYVNDLIDMSYQVALNSSEESDD